MNNDKNSKLEYIEANSKKGFNFGYILNIPDKCYEQNITTLVAEMNNTGKPASYEKELYENVCSYFKNSMVSKMIEDLGLPYLMPLFPRYIDEYTHSLSRQALLSEKEEIKRIDKQFINMIEDARERLRNKGINIDNKFILNGFSASGAFSNRFAIIYPELLKCVISGGQSYAMIPLKEYDKHKLTYPIGIYDLEDIIDIKFNAKEYFKLPQLIYEGDQNNDNDTTKYFDCMSVDQAEMIYSIFGNIPKSERLKKQNEMYKKQNYSNITIKVYEEVGHIPQVEDVKKFISNLL